MDNLLKNNKFIYPVLTVLLSILIYIFIKNFLKKIFGYENKKLHMDNRKVKSINLLFVNTLKVLIIAIDAIIILEIYGIKTTTLLTSLGALGIVVGLAFQDTLKDVFAGIFIIIQNQFIVGDFVEINGFKGEVIGIGLKITRIKAYTGEVAIISNRNIDKIINYNLSESRAMVDISIDYDEDVDRVIDILNKMSDRLDKNIKYTTDKIEVLGVQKFGDSYIVIRVSVLTKPMKNFIVERELNKLVLQELKNYNIKI